MGKRVLIIGNGFDLAHNLPTRYSDFLEFSERFCSMFEYDATADALDMFRTDRLENWNTNAEIKKQLETLFLQRQPIYEKSGSTIIKGYVLNNKALDSFSEKLTKNIWFGYLSQLYDTGKMRGINWIDFESEISGIIQVLDKHCYRLEDTYRNIFLSMNEGKRIMGKVPIFYNIVTKAGISDNTTSEAFINRLYADLERMTEALEIYLYRFVEEIPVSPIPQIGYIKPDLIISFNYTHTYQRLYDKNVPVCYIHGECKNSLSTCDMVLGIDEYLDSEKQNTNTNMAIFKKFVQRIRKKNNTKYQIWKREIQLSYEKSARRSGKQAHIDTPEIYVYGHSLDITDKDILKLFLAPKYCALHIYAKGKTNEGKLISNMIKIMGEEELIRKSTESPSLLEMHVVL